MCPASSNVKRPLTMDEENTTTTAAAAGESPETAGQNEESTAAAAQEKTDNATTVDTSGPDAPSTTKDTAASSGRPKRVRKSATNYVPEEETKKEIAIPDGKGEKLEDMPNVVANFKDVTWSTPCLKSLYNIVFGVGKRADFKKHLLQFNGLSFSEDKEDAEFEKVSQKVSCLSNSVLGRCDISLIVIFNMYNSSYSS